MREPYVYTLGNANPGGIFQTRVYRFDGLQTRVPGLWLCHSGGRPVVTVGLQLVESVRWPVEVA